MQAAVQDQAALREYLSRGIAEVADAPRSAERSDARRRLLAALPRALAGAVSGGGGDVAQDWFQEVCAEAVHVDVRRALSDALVLLHESAHGLSSAVVDDLRAIAGGQRQAAARSNPVTARHRTGKAFAPDPMRSSAAAG